ncbi:MAG TPA: hypothetical protein VGS19_26010 [Streptosporangiaceae bacterium]|nr:hypothetical protein [Streptosporangiaceae bacterium]
MVGVVAVAAGGARAADGRAEGGRQMPGEVSGQGPEPREPTPAAPVSGPPQPAVGGGTDWRKYLGSAIFGVVGLVLLVSAWLAYPPPETGIATPAYPTLVITTYQAMASVVYSVQPVHSATELRVTFRLFSPLPSVTPGPLPPMAEIDLPPGARFPGQPGYITALPMPLDFGSGTTATVVFLVGGHSFNADSNGVNAYAALPEVRYQVPPGSVGFEPPTLWARYQIPSAASYDWSSFRPAMYDRSGPEWEEFLTRYSGDTAARTALGIDHTRQASDADWTFVAGALLGLGGGAVLSALQELMQQVLA